MWWRAMMAFAGGLILVYGLLLVVLWRYAKAHPETLRLRDALRLLPDLLRLLRRLVADTSQPLRVRVRLGLLLASGTTQGSAPRLNPNRLPAPH